MEGTCEGGGRWRRGKVKRLSDVSDRDGWMEDRWMGFLGGETEKEREEFFLSFNGIFSFFVFC